MNTPWPTRLQLRHEAAADALLADQAASDLVFQAIVTTAKAAIEALHFPLGFPVPGYDIDDVTGTLTDWLAPRDAGWLQVLANDATHDASFAEAA